MRDLEGGTKKLLNSSWGRGEEKRGEEEAHRFKGESGANPKQQTRRIENKVFVIEAVQCFSPG